jgi:hypothetical protein
MLDFVLMNLIDVSILGQACRRFLFYLIIK